MKKIILTVGCVVTALLAMGLGYAIDLYSEVGAVTLSCFISFVGFIGYVIADWIAYKHDNKNKIK